MSDRRQTLLINPAQQRRFILSTVLAVIILINVALSSAVIWTPTLLAKITSFEMAVVVAIELVVVAIAAYYGLITSHRVAGPAYALKRDMERIRSGDLTVRTRLRKQDISPEVGEVLCQTTEDLCERLHRLKTIGYRLDQMEDLSPETRALVDELRDELAHFKTDPAELNADNETTP